MDTLEYFDYEIERVVDLAFRLAQNRRKKVTLVDKANVLESSRLWRQVAGQVAAALPGGQHWTTLLVDTASMRLITIPGRV